MKKEVAPHLRLNYASLQMPISQDEIREHKKRYKGASGPVIIPIWTFFALIIPGVIFFLIAAAWKSTLPFILVPAALYIPSILIFLFIKSRQPSEDDVRLHRFAKANQLTVDFQVDAKKLNGAIFPRYHRGIKLASKLTFADGSWIGNYRSPTSPSRDGEDVNWKIACIPLSRQLPHIILDAEINNTFSTNLPTSFQGRRLKLEGNFNDFFKVFVPKQYERDALYLLTPNVMADLIDYGHDYDIEIIDDKLYLYGSGFMSFSGGYDIASLLKSAKAISSSLSKQASAYSDQRTGDYSVNTVASQGKRVKRKAIGLSLIKKFQLIFTISLVVVLALIAILTRQ